MCSLLYLAFFMEHNDFQVHLVAGSSTSFIFMSTQLLLDTLENACSPQAVTMSHNPGVAGAGATEPVIIFNPVGSKWSR
jgi:hypothetical protein